MKGKTLRELKREVLEPISYYGKPFDDSFYMAKHAHPYLEIMYCKSGKFCFEVESSRKARTFVTYDIFPGSFIFIDANIFHRIKLKRGDSAFIYNIEFEVKPPSAFNPYGINEAVEVDFSHLTSSCGGLKKLSDRPQGFAILNDTETLAGLIVKLLDVLNDGIDSFEAAYAVKTGTLNILLEMGKCCAAASGETGVTYIRRAMDFIKQNFNKKISAEDVATHAGVNKSYLQKLFKVHVGSTVIKTVNYYRVEKCKKLLSGTNLTIENICSETGFDNRQHLIYEFKAFEKESPSEYRKRAADAHIDHYTIFHDSVYIDD